MSMHLRDGDGTGGCFTNVSRALQKILSKFVYCTSSTCDENFKLKLCTCAQSLALGTRTNFRIEILTINVISGVVYFRENILGSSRNVNETAPRVPGEASSRCQAAGKMLDRGVHPIEIIQNSTQFKLILHWINTSRSLLSNLCLNF